MAHMRSCLETAFAPDELDIIDDSHLHAGHAGAKSGKGHFSVRIISERFSGKKPLDRHRMVFEALGEMMEKDIHALSVTATAPRQIK